MSAVPNAAWALAVVAALGFFLAVMARANLAGRRARWLRAGLIAAAAGLTFVANVALYKRDAHLDVTYERAFTPSPESMRIVAALDRDVDLVYFYQKQNPAGTAARTMLDVLGRANSHLKVRTVDPDQNPGLANRLGMKLYNTAVLQAEGRRIDVTSTDDREIMLGLLRLLRSDARPVCFATGHGQYDIDNFEFHTHFEGTQAHGHDAHGMAAVQMEQHGLGRMRRALDKLGYALRKVNLPLERTVPTECALWIEANPRYRMGPPELAALGRYLDAGGAMLWLIEPDIEIAPDLAQLFARAGLAVGDGVVVDPAKHYYTDEQMVAISQYANHPALQALGLSFFPGARPLALRPAPGVKSSVLFASSEAAYVRARSAEQGEPLARGAQPLAIASEGAAEGGTVFRLAVVGDADFASNSFFPYLANADLALGLAAWAKGEARGPAMKPPAEVLPLVTLTNDQTRLIFITTVLLLPGSVATLGGAVWWRRRW